MDVFKFAEDAKEQAKLLLRKDGTHCPIIICMTPTGKSIIPLTISSEVEKLRVLAVVKKFMEKTNVWAYISINKGWMVTGDSNKPINLQERPSLSPDRVEILMVSAVTRKRTISWMIPVEKKYGIIMFGKEKVFDTQNNSKLGGLFMDLLPRTH